MKCEVCGKVLKNNKENMCDECFKFYAWKYKTQEVEEILEQYDIQKKADKKR